MQISQSADRRQHTHASCYRSKPNVKPEVRTVQVESAIQNLTCGQWPKFITDNNRLRNPTDLPGNRAALWIAVVQPVVPRHLAFPRLQFSFVRDGSTRFTLLSRSSRSCTQYFSTRQYGSVQQRKLYPEDRPFSLDALHICRSPVGAADCLDNGQTKSRASGLARPCLVGSIKAVEDQGKSTWRNTDTGVGHSEYSFHVLFVNGYTDISSNRSVLDRIVHEIDSDLLQPHRITCDIRGQSRFKAKRDTFFL